MNRANKAVPFLSFTSSFCLSFWCLMQLMMVCFLLYILFTCIVVHLSHIRMPLTDAKYFLTVSLLSSVLVHNNPTVINSLVSPLFVSFAHILLGESFEPCAHAIVLTHSLFSRALPLFQLRMTSHLAQNFIVQAALWCCFL